MDGQTFVAGARATDAIVRVRAGTLHAQVPVRITATPAYVDILPQNPALRNGGSLALQARAFDARGYPVAIPQLLDWQTDRGIIDRDGRLRVGDRNVEVSVALGTARARTLVTVGEHELELPLQRYARFSTAPKAGPGSLEPGTPCADCTTLRYDFSGKERAAYAQASIALPQRALGISADVFGDGNGEILRIAVNNAINERFLYTVATVDWHGWRRVEFDFPPALPQPITFKSLYVINRVGPSPPVRTAGFVAVRNMQVILAGNSGDAPKYTHR